MYKIDWELTQQIWSSFSSVGLLLAAFLGLRTWRQQLFGTSQFQTAKSALMHAYKVQSAIQAVRAPSLYISQKDIDEGRKVEAEQDIYQERMAALGKEWVELQAVRIEAKAMFGVKGYDSFKILDEKIGKLRGALWLHFWMLGAYAGPFATVDKSPDRIERNNRIVYYVSEEDEFSQEIALAVSEIEKYFSDKIQMRWWQFQ